MEGVTGSIPVAPTIFSPSADVSPPRFVSIDCQAMTHPRRWFLALLVFLIVCSGLALAWVFDGATSIDALQARIASFGVWAPVGFILIYAIATVALIPGGIFDVVGGVLFGPILGSIYNLAGASFGAAGGFLIARYLAGDWVEARAGPRMQKSSKASRPTAGALSPLCGWCRSFLTPLSTICSA